MTITSEKKKKKKKVGRLRHCAILGINENENLKDLV